MGRGPAFLSANRSPSVLIGPADLLTGLRSCQLHLFTRELDHGMRAAEPAMTFPCLSCLSSESTCYPRFPCSDPGPLFSFFPSGSPHPFLLVLNYSTFDSLGTSELMKYFLTFITALHLHQGDGEALKMPSNCQVFLLKMQTSPK